MPVPNRSKDNKMDGSAKHKHGCQCPGLLLDPSDHVHPSLPSPLNQPLFNAPSMSRSLALFQGVCLSKSAGLGFGVPIVVIPWDDLQSPVPPPSADSSREWTNPSSPRADLLFSLFFPVSEDRARERGMPAFSSLCHHGWTGRA